MSSAKGGRKEVAILGTEPMAWSPPAAPAEGVEGPAPPAVEPARETEGEVRAEEAPAAAV